MRNLQGDEIYCGEGDDDDEAVVKGDVGLCLVMLKVLITSWFENGEGGFVTMYSKQLAWLMPEFIN